MGELIEVDRSSGRILFATTVLPGANSSGGEIVTSRFIQALRRLGYCVTVLGYGRSGYAAMEGEKLVEVRPIEMQKVSAQTLSFAIMGYLRGRALSVQKYVGSAYRARLLRELESTKWDAVIIDHAQMAWILPYLINQRCIHICHNNESFLYEVRVNSTSGLNRLMLAREAAIMHKSESALAKSCAAIWTLTRRDAQYFELLGASNVRPFAIPGTVFLQDRCTHPPTIDIALLGTWTWAPNRAGLDWFCTEVLPFLPLTFNITIGGGGADYLKDRYPNVRVIGRVPNAAAFLAGAKCIAIPSTQGTGIQIKTLDAIAIGRPIVATTIALREIERPPSRVQIIDWAPDFASRLINLVNQPPRSEKDRWAFNRETKFFAMVKDALLDNCPSP